MGADGFLYENGHLRDPYYLKKCHKHQVEDPNDKECTFKPKLITPLGRRAEPGETIQDNSPVKFDPKQTFSTKNSIQYHYNRLIHTRNPGMKTKNGLNLDSGLYL